MENERQPDNEPCAMCGDPDCFAHVSVSDLERIAAGNVAGVRFMTECEEANQREWALRTYGSADPMYALAQLSRELAALAGYCSGPES